MAVFQRMFDFISKYLTVFRLPRVGILDVLEIIILAFLLYQVMKWMKKLPSGFAFFLVTWFMALMEKLFFFVRYLWTRKKTSVIRIAITAIADAKLWLVPTSPTYSL